MATIQEATIQQSTGEIRQWAVDFTDDLPTGVTVSAGTAIHTPPSGSASTPTISASTIAVTATIGTLAVTGIHYLDIQATFSNGEKSEVRIPFTVNYPAVTAREGMLPLVRSLRAFTAAGPNDYLIAGEPYWSDAQLQEILDNNREEIIHEELDSVVEYTGGAPFTKRHLSYHGNYESGTAVFWLEDGAGSTASTALYTADYVMGKFTFAADTGGTVYYLTGRSYDLNAAAADVWDRKADHYAEVYDFSTDGHSLKRSQLVAQCEKQAEKYRSRANKNTEPLTLGRDDANAFTY